LIVEGVTTIELQSKKHSSRSSLVLTFGQRGSYTTNLRER